MRLLALFIRRNATTTTTAMLGDFKRRELERSFAEVVRSKVARTHTRYTCAAKRARRDRSRAVLRCIPRTFNAFLRDLMHACICYSECDEGRTRALHIARRKTSSRLSLAAILSRSGHAKLYTQTRHETFLDRTPLECAFQSISKRDKSGCTNSTINFISSQYRNILIAAQSRKKYCICRTFCSSTTQITMTRESLTNNSIAISRRPSALQNGFPFPRTRSWK